VLAVDLGAMSAGVVRFACAPSLATAWAVVGPSGEGRFFEPLAAIYPKAN
jgi:hypothetical protein